MSSLLTEIDLEPLMEVLKLELQEYQVLFKQLKTQQDLIFQRALGELGAVNQALETQIRINSALKARRLHALSALSVQVGGGVRIQTITELLPHVVPSAQSLLDALVHEVNLLVERTRSVVHQNRSLLARACEITEQVLRIHRPSGTLKTYDQTGLLSIKPSGGFSRIHFSA